MDRQSYLEALSQALQNAGVKERDEALRQFSNHFKCRMSDGCSEEEVAAKLPSPAVVAKRYACGKCSSRTRIKVKTGLTGLAAALLLLLLLAIVLAFLGVTIASVASSARLILGLWQPAPLEQYPFVATLLLGIAGMGIGVLSALGTLTGAFFGRRCIRHYLCWRRHYLRAPYCLHPPLLPVIAERKRGRIRLAAKSAAITTGLALVAAFVLLSAYTGYHPFWREFGWL